MRRYPVCRSSELLPGQRKLIDVDGKSIGIFNVKGTYYALRNLCPHQFAPLCLGKVTGSCEDSPVGEFRWARDGEIIRCPWHSWEFDIKTGRSIFNPHKVRTKTYTVAVEPVPCETNDDPSVETIPVDVEEGQIVIYA